HTTVTDTCAARRYRHRRGRWDKHPHPGWEYWVGSTGTRFHRRSDRGGAGVSHNTLLVFELTILVLAIFLGFEVISKVPTLLHTPLMSGTNAIHGIVVVGAMVVLGSPHKDTFDWVIGFLAVVLGSANVVGGFVVTDRMLEMFKKREAPRPADGGHDGKNAE